jgi:hypothetical protein
MFSACDVRYTRYTVTLVHHQRLMHILSVTFFVTTVTYSF